MASEAEQRKMERKIRATFRAQTALRHSFERIEDDEDRIKPFIQSLRDKNVTSIDLDPGSLLELEEGS